MKNSFILTVLFTVLGLSLISCGDDEDGSSSNPADLVGVYETYYVSDANGESRAITETLNITLASQGILSYSFVGEFGLEGDFTNFTYTVSGSTITFDFVDFTYTTEYSYFPETGLLRFETWEQYYDGVEKNEGITFTKQND